MYNLLAEQYSKLFPPDDQRCSFIIDEIDEANNANPALLDAGCATGDLAFELSAAGAAVTGIDLDADMIRIAQQRKAELQKSEMSGSIPSFFCRSMTELGGLGSFNAVVCFGNTLPHLPTTELVEEFFTETADVLRSGGKLIFQIINFDRLPKNGDFNFPEITTGETVFRRSYSRREDGRINFNISLKDLQSAAVESDSTPLLPLTRTEINGLLSDSGFSNIRIYSGYDRTAADGSEFASIYSAVL